MTVKPQTKEANILTFFKYITCFTYVPTIFIYFRSSFWDKPYVFPRLNYVRSQGSIIDYTKVSINYQSCEVINKHTQKSCILILGDDGQKSNHKL